MEIGNHKNVSEYDGSFKCLDCQSLWGALPGKPVMPKVCKGRDARVKRLVNEQAEDDGLWFDAKTAPEAYLQDELRKLHRLIENE